jgi:hypothetical protein
MLSLATKPMIISTTSSPNISLNVMQMHFFFSEMQMSYCVLECSQGLTSRMQLIEISPKNDHGSYLTAQQTLMFQGHAWFEYDS